MREPFAVAEAATPALMVLAYPSRVGTDTPFSRTVGPHPVRRSSSSLDLRCSPLDLSRRRDGPRGFPAPDPLWVLADEVPSAPSVSLASPSVRLLSPWISLLIRLSWASPAFAPCLRSTLLSVHSRLVLPPPFGAPAPPAAHHVPPSWILTTSAAFSALEVRAYCSPIRTGFVAFRVARSRAPAGRPESLAPVARATCAVPRKRGSYPSKHSPRQ